MLTLGPHNRTWVRLSTLAKSEGPSGVWSYTNQNLMLDVKLHAVKICDDGKYGNEIMMQVYHTRKRESMFLFLHPQEYWTLRGCSIVSVAFLELVGRFE